MASTPKDKQPKNNPVAKWGRRFNRATVMVDRKKKQKKNKARGNVCVWDLEKEG
jgi:hypothetical protein